MSLVLSRVDYATVGVTSRGTTKILPSADPKQTQKFAVADHDGILHVYGKFFFLLMLFQRTEFTQLSKKKFWIFHATEGIFQGISDNQKYPKKQLCYLFSFRVSILFTE